MRKIVIQRVLFIACLITALLNQMLEQLTWIRYFLLAGSLIYLFFGWYFPMIKEEKAYLKNELAGFIYSTVFFANFMDSAQMPLSKYLVYFGDMLAIGLMVYMVLKKKTVKRDMLMQSVLLFLVSPVPMWI